MIKNKLNILRVHLPGHIRTFTGFYDSLFREGKLLYIRVRILIWDQSPILTKFHYFKFKSVLAHKSSSINVKEFSTLKEEVFFQLVLHQNLLVIWLKCGKLDVSTLTSEASDIVFPVQIPTYFRLHTLEYTLEHLLTFVFSAQTKEIKY